MSKQYYCEDGHSKDSPDDTCWICYELAYRVTSEEEEIKLLEKYGKHKYKPLTSLPPTE